MKVDTARILDAAQQVFATHGLQGASVRAIARAAGCDPALIYYHFEAKEALFQALLDRKLPPLVADLEGLAAAPGTTRDRLRGVMDVYIAHFAADAGFRAVIRGEIMRGAGGTREALAQRLRHVSAQVQGLIRQGQAAGDVRPDLDPQLTAFFFIKLTMEILEVVPILAPILSGRPPQEATAAAHAAWFELYWRGIAAPPASDIR